MFVGIDVAKDRLDVHLRPAGEAFTVARDGEGIEALVDRLATLKVELVVLEALRVVAAVDLRGVLLRVVAGLRPPVLLVVAIRLWFSLGLKV